jgi:hypothetical protein
LLHVDRNKLGNISPLVTEHWLSARSLERSISSHLEVTKPCQHRSSRIAHEEESVAGEGNIERAAGVVYSSRFEVESRAANERTISRSWANFRVSLVLYFAHDIGEFGSSALERWSARVGYVVAHDRYRLSVRGDSFPACIDR